MTRAQYKQKCQDASRRVFGRRDSALYERHLLGESMAEIGARYGLSRQRVHQIVDRMTREEKEA
jgi:Mor family transcriptional regulator